MSHSLLEGIGSEITFLKKNAVPTWHRKNRCMIFTSGMMTHEKSYVLRCLLKNGTLC